MDITLSRSTVAGEARAPPSKSYTHRAILAAGYARETTVHAPLVSADTKATMRAVEGMGGDVERGDRSLTVTGFDGRPNVPTDVVDCANSGTTIRLATAAAALADGITVLTGDESLRSRPQGPLLAAIDQLGGRAESTRDTGEAPLVVKGPVAGGEVSIPGDVSSQFITGLLMAGAVTDEGITIDLETELKSAPYVDITLEVLDAFGIDAEKRPDGFVVPGGQRYEPAGAEGDAPDDEAESGRGEYHVPGDFSSISYLVAAGALAAESGEAVHVRGAHPSAQGDAAIVEILERMGADIEWDRKEGVVTVRRSALSGIEVDVSDTPDLLPTIAALGAAADGETRIVNAEHVRYKETDRVSAMATELEKMGASVTETEETLTVHGDDSELRGARVAGHDDHRIVMSLAVAGLVADGRTTIEGGEHVDVSFPNFFDVLYDLGVDVERTGKSDE